MKLSITLFFITAASVFFTGSYNSLFAQSYDQTIPGSSVKFRMVSIPPGEFIMGSAPFEKGRDDDEGPQRNVVISAFWIAEHEVTFAEWDAFFKNMDVPQTKVIAVDAVSRPTAQYIDLTWGMGRDPKNPTNSMSQAAGIMYCKWLYNTTGIFYRLPTEAEWEYACRAGGTTDPENLKDYGYYKENSAAKFHKVAQLKPNAWGLYDMLGNLSEWTLDQYDANVFQKLADKTKNPTTSIGPRYPRVTRGGSYLDEAKELRCANRISSTTDWNKRDPQIPKSRWWLTDGMGIGFRIVRPGQAPSKEEIEKFYALYLK
ncbi:MAG TPA: SUMF1/EgtB/PvdO family nonheme iron enzyme [Chryseolinea sp.]|nr:SUMF1/EgtB/PvdO family nonheme iron enzyme [Chryseolinea sp.]HPM30464.1 SUMF1/EgtB/PvdO family nonheme iron enzyme [Chryseolinea sp.]